MRKKALTLLRFKAFPITGQQLYRFAALKGPSLERLARFLHKSYQPHSDLFISLMASPQK